jgi:hypothetical protein
MVTNGLEIIPCRFLGIFNLLFLSYIYYAKNITRLCSEELESIDAKIAGVETDANVGPHPFNIVGSLDGVLTNLAIALGYLPATNQIMR